MAGPSGLVYRGAPGAPRPRPREPVGAALARCRPDELRLPAPPDWHPSAAAAVWAAALVAAVALGLPRVRLGSVLLGRTDPVDAAVLTLLASRAALTADSSEVGAAQTRSSRTVQRGGAVPARTARSMAARPRPGCPRC
ncbi:hypothetical protein JOD57_000060 [Geodermatophilus bullaregiensis]|uniref:hypothetical protein n=1 Tax=Geodermatophilus bullaregiensis TaxID=1564160 RepID=UPI00195EEDDA|nr:hypothetical protein [Geodermatophilus bullaregiensis]MBM7804223.1 hypothetical protein [Geodermatophilus bullaregiensis]